MTTEQETREYNRRERTKQLLAKSQQCKQIMREDNVIDLEDNSADDDVPISFDGVRVDIVINEKNRQHVDNLKRRLVGREDEIDVVRKRDFRGSKHDKTPAMDISSSKLTSPLSRGNGKRIQGRKTRLHNNNNNSGSKDSFASSRGGMDLLDYARNLQEGNRWMEKIPQLGKGSMNTKRTMLAHAATKRQELSHGLLSMIESMCKAKGSSKGKELSSNDTILPAAQKARDTKHKCKLQINETIACRNKKRKSIASKDDQVALKEHIALLEKDNARLNDILRQAKPIVETIDLTTNEAERATKRSRTERNVKSTLAIMYEQNQKVVHIKKEKMDTEIALESIRGEKNVVTGG